MIIIISLMAHASSCMNLPLALLVFLLSGVVSSSSSAPAALDWRNNNGTNYVTSVKDQYILEGVLCDNSWAFAAVSVVESALLIKNSSTEGGLDLSEQQVLDCTLLKRRYLNGCRYGTARDALRFITTRGGLSRERDYPGLYTGLNTGFCLSRKPRRSMVSTQGLTYQQVGFDEDELAQTLATHGPVAVTICYHPDLSSYSEGIFNNLDCPGSCYDRISMTLVGYGTQDGVPYWILKNSWGRAWGERGFLRLARGSNLCGIITYFSYSLLA